MGMMTQTFRHTIVQEGRRSRWSGLLTITTLIAALIVAFGPSAWAQLQQSGGPGNSVTLLAGTAIVGKVGIDQTTPGTTNGVQVNAALPAGTNNIGDVDVLTLPALPAGTNNIGDVDVLTLPALTAGTNIIGFVRVLPPSCTQTTSVTFSTTQVATGAGTTVTTTTTCATLVYANNITNSSVTLRLADRQGTPVIWLGGNADFTIPANSNLRLPVEGVIFTSGITAIAGTASAINLQTNGMQ